MADQQTDWRINFNDDGMLEALKALSAQSERFAKSLEDVEKANEVAFDDKEVKDFEDSLNKMGKTMVDNERKTKAQASALDEVKNKATEAARGVTLFGVNLGQVADNLQGFVKGMRASIVGTTGMAKALKVLKVALISTGVGAIVVALGSLVAFLSQTQKGMDLVSKVTTIVGEVFQRALLSVAAFGEALIRISHLDFKGAMEAAARGVDGLGKSFTEGIAAGNELYNLMIRIREETQTANQVIAATNLEIAQQKKLAEDTNRALSDRIKSYDRILNLIDAQESESLKLARSEEEQARKNLERAVENEEAQNAFFEAQQRLNEVEREAEEKRLEIQNARNAAIDEYKQKIKALSDTIQAFVDDFSPDGREPATRFLQNFVDEIQKEIERDPDYVQGILDGAFKDYEVPLRVRPEIPPEWDGDVPPSLVDSLRDQIANIEDILGEGAAAGLEEVYRERLKALRDELAEALADGTGDGLQAFAQKIQESIPDIQASIGNVGEILSSFTQPQLDAQEQLVDSLRNTTETLERQLESQYRLREQGYASDVTALEAKLQQENAALERAERKKLELQRKAAREQLLLDSLQQASNLALAVSKLLAGSASNPFTFIAAATAGVAAIFSIFSNVKQLAQDQTAVPAFREGGPVDGPSHEQGGVLAELEGGEYVMSRSAVNAHGDLIEAINEGSLYDYLPGLVHSAEGAQKAIAMRSAERIEHGAALQAAEKMIEYWKTRPIDTPLDTKFIREFQIGNTKIKRRFS